jgi:hypothetical protein
MDFSPNGFLNQVLGNAQELIMRHVNMIAARPYLGLSGDERGWKSLKINVSRLSGHY